jgi:Ca2+-binding EF-hand superfamily protein
MTATTATTYRATAEFKPEGPGEVPLSIGEVVQIVGEANNGWIKIIKHNNNNVEGYVPFSYLQFVQPSAPVGVTRPIRAAPTSTTTTTTSNNNPPSRISSSTGGGQHISIEHAECAICCEALHALPCCVFTNASSKRTCRHFLHLACANTLIRSGLMQCPICRAQFRGVLPVPDFDKEPKKWFEIVDFDGNKSLSQTEVIEVFKALLPIDYRRLEREVETFWPRWDQNRSGELDFKEICDPQNGLLVYVRNTFKNGSGSSSKIPTLTPTTKREWFAFFDEDSSGSLSQDEVTRALIKTFLPGASQNLEKLREMRSSVMAVWSLFDLDGSGEIDIHEFCARDGLADTIIASL